MQLRLFFFFFFKCALWGNGLLHHILFIVCVIVAAEVTCAPNQFQCAMSKRCVPRVWVCDRDNDCMDGSDEPANCSKDATTGGAAALVWICRLLINPWNPPVLQLRWRAAWTSSAVRTRDAASRLSGSATANPTVAMIRMSRRRSVVRKVLLKGLRWGGLGRSSDS